MEFYPHQQQQQQQQKQEQHTSQQQQVDDGSISGSATNTSTINSNKNKNSSSGNNNNINRSSSTNINTLPTSPPDTATTTVVAADAATVAVAKDMLQLHHGNSTLSNNHNNNNNNTSSSNNNNTDNSNNNSLEVMNTANANSVAAAAGSNIAVVSPLVTTTATTINTHPPAQASAVNAASTGVITAPENALGYLKYDQELLYITEPCTIIGRNSSTSHVHFHVAENNLVSRKHFQVLFDSATRDFYVQCLSKNGIFVDDFLQRRNADPLKLPSSCYFRFPSTEIRIHFESFMNSGLNSALNNSASSGSSTTYHNNNHHAVGVPNSGSGSAGAHVIISPAPPDDHPHAAHSQTHMSHHHQQQQHSSSNAVSSSTHLLPHMDNSNVYSPLKISIPKKEQKSPYLSPTGTISAANSCPASPRQGFHQNQSNYNNYGNNNIQNQDLFQTPSTASYNHNEKPPYSYAQLIVQAISAAPDKQLTLSGIYSFIVKHYPYYRKETNKGWQNSIRHNLSLNRYFIKVARSQDEPGKGSFWRIDPDSGAKLIDHSYKKRRQRSSQGFRPSYGMPRSAPVSPSHMDNSRESSPIPDYILQSAPGSPGMSLENRATDGDLMYNTQNMHQSTANNSHNQYNSSSSPYFVSNQNSSSGLSGAQQQQLHNESGNGNNSGNGVGALIALKRNHVMAAGAAANSGAMGSQQQSQQQPQSLHPDIIYEDMPTDYSGNMESGDECDAAKRPKYISEVL